MKIDNASSRGYNGRVALLSAGSFIRRTSLASCNSPASSSSSNDFEIGSSLETADDPAVDSFLLRLANGEVVRTRTVVIASGARYRRLAVDKLEEFESSSIHYWASPLEAKLCEGQEVILVGAGNSAGQATATGRQRLGLSRAEAIFRRICLAIS